MHPLPTTTNKNLKKLALTISFISSFALVLPGCRIPGLQQPDQVHSLPDTFKDEINWENSSQVALEEFFEDPILKSLIDQALCDNLQLKILAQDIQIAENEVLKRSGAYLPFLNFASGAGLNKFSPYTLTGADNSQNLLPNGSNFPKPLPDFLVGVNVSWQVDIWRQLRNARDAAAFRYLGTMDGRNYVVTRLIAEISENYYQLMALDKRLETLDKTIGLQEKSLEMTQALKVGARGTELPVQRFQADVRKYQSEKILIKQEIVQVENRINFLAGRFPQTVERSTGEYINLNMHTLSTGVPSQLLQNRPDIREAERELAATGLDVKSAKARFYPQLFISGGVGYEAFNPKYLIASPESLIYSVAGDLTAPVINRRAIKADYLTANATQLQAVYNYQRTILNAFTEVVNLTNKVQNYGKSLELKKEQLVSLESAVDSATKLFQNARVEYVDVLLVQRDLNQARFDLIETKQGQLSAIVNAYQALGGGLVRYTYEETSTPVYVQSDMPSDQTLPSPVPVEGQ